MPFNEIPPLMPSSLPETDDVVLFTADQVAAAVGAAVTAHAAGEDPAQAAKDALAT